VENLVCPLFGGLPATGAIARTSKNAHNGGRTMIAGIFHALTLLAMVLVAARQAVHRTPMTALSAVLVAVALRMGE
jgi:SulP family sulfate permease